MLILDEKAVESLLRMEEVIPAMERALADLSAGTVVQPVRTMLPVAPHGGFLGLVTATTSRTPVLEGEWLAPGAHVNAVGACLPDWREMDDAVLRRGRLYVDSRAAAMKESGDVIAAGDIAGEIGELVAGRAAGRRS